MSRIFDNKFNIGDEVAFDGKMGWITGVELYLGYNIRLWQYTITRVMYQGDVGNQRPWEYGGDVNRADKVPEDKIITIKEFAEQRKESLQAEADVMQEKLNALNEELKGNP